MTNLFPQFRKFVPPAKSPPLEANEVGPAVEPAPSAAVQSPGRTESPPLEATPTPAVATRIAPTVPTRPESPPGSKPAPAGQPDASADPAADPAAAPVHEVGRDRLQVFVPACEQCLSSVYLERRYSDGSESLTCVCCGAAVDGDPKPGLTAERRAKREAERAKMAGRFAEGK